MAMTLSLFWGFGFPLEGVTDLQFDCLMFGTQLFERGVATTLATEVNANTNAAFRF